MIAGPARIRGSALKAKFDASTGRVEHCQPTHRTKYGDDDLADQKCARGLLDSQLQNEEGRYQAEAARNQHEQDHVAESGHAAGVLRIVGRGEQHVNGHGGRSAGDRQGVACSYQKQLVGYAHARCRLPTITPSSRRDICLDPCRTRIVDSHSLNAASFSVKGASGFRGRQLGDCLVLRLHESG
jgi:hypothetical protein